MKTYKLPTYHIRNKSIKKQNYTYFLDQICTLHDQRKKFLHISSIFKKMVPYTKMKQNWYMIHSYFVSLNYRKNVLSLISCNYIYFLLEPLTLKWKVSLTSRCKALTELSH